MDNILKLMKLLPVGFEIKPLRTRERWQKMEQETLEIAQKILNEKRNARLKEEIKYVVE